MRDFWPNLRGALLRVFPDCLTQAQASAFGMFLSFFPLLLLSLGVLTSSHRLGGALDELLLGLRQILPPGSQHLLSDFLADHPLHPWRWTLLGLFGTLLGGTQVMTGLMEGFRVAYHESFTIRPPYWRLQARAVALLLVTLAPGIVAVGVSVFGKQLRHWMILKFGLAGLFDVLWTVVHIGLAFVLAILILALLYRVGHAERLGWNQVLPGAVVATLLWWAVNATFGFYVTHMPYSVVYGGLATAIGLLIWMNLSAVVILIGSAYNAESQARGNAAGAGPSLPAGTPPVKAPA